MCQPSSGPERPSANAERRPAGAVTFAPLVFAASEAFKSDWGEDRAMLGSRQTKLQVAHTKLSHIAHMPREHHAHALKQSGTIRQAANITAKTYGSGIAAEAYQGCPPGTGAGPRRGWGALAGAVRVRYIVASTRPAPSHARGMRSRSLPVRYIISNMGEVYDTQGKFARVRRGVQRRLRPSAEAESISEGLLRKSGGASAGCWAGDGRGGWCCGGCRGAGGRRAPRAG